MSVARVRIVRPSSEQKHGQPHWFAMAWSVRLRDVVATAGSDDDVVGV